MARLERLEAIALGQRLQSQKLAFMNVHDDASR